MLSSSRGAATLIVAVALTVYGAPLIAAPSICPETLDSHPLNGVEVFDGHPSELASLVPDKDIAAGSNKATWNFKPKGRPIWVVCSYRDVIRTVTQELSPGVRQCVARYRNRTPVAIDCK
jgi:hypothetical protein